MTIKFAQPCLNSLPPSPVLPAMIVADPRIQPFGKYNLQLRRVVDEANLVWHLNLRLPILRVKPITALTDLLFEHELEFGRKYARR